MINVTIGESKPQEKPFPKLMKDDNGDIFYMFRNQYGLPITGGDKWLYTGKDFADFSKNGRTFTDYNEPITIQNA
jgi:hypothetical protein